MPESKFYHPFQKPTQEEWQKLLGDSAQKQFSISDKLQSPVFVHDDNATHHPPLTDRSDNNWNIVGVINTPNTTKANTLALEALRGGIDEVLFILRKPNLHTLFKDIELPMIHTAFEWKIPSAQKATDFINKLYDFMLQKGWNHQQLKGSFQLDPFTKSNRLRPHLQTYLDTGLQQFPNFQLLTIRQDTSLDIELAFAKIIKQVEKLLHSSKDKALIINKIQFRLIAKQNIITTISTIRAFKLLWFQLLKQNNLPMAAPDISVVLDQSKWQDDVNQNRILATSQAMAAVIAGINHLIIPSTKSNSFSERISRNIQHIMKMESNMDRVVDPAAGSKMIEALTETIAQAAWDS